MAILPQAFGAREVAKRDEIRCYTNGQCYDYSRWNDWGRWVALAAVVVGILIVAYLFSCFNNRRRRRRGMAPMYGTGWVPGQAYKPNDNGQYGYYGGQAAPPYSAQQVIPNQQTGNTFNSNDGYYGQQNYGHNPYGGQQSGIELQQPQNAYQPRAGDNVYAAPPPKNDGIVR